MTFPAQVLDAAAEWLRVPAPALRGILLAAGYLVLAFLLYRLITRLGIPAAQRARTHMHEIILQAVAGPASATLVVLGVLAGARLAIPGPQHADLYSRVLTTSMLIIWGVAVGRVLAHFLFSAARHHPDSPHARATALMARFAKVAVGVLILLTLLAVWGVDVTPLIAGAGLVGIAFAFAAQETLGNFFAGVAVYLDKLYDIGDWVVLDQGGASELRGEIKDIGFRSTRILTRDDVYVIVPNSVIANGLVVNESTQTQQYRVRIPVTVSYTADLDHVERVLAEVGTAHRLVLRDPAPRARVRRFAESGIDMELLVWIVNPPDRGIVVHDLSKQVHATFRREGIVIPFPQRDVHMVSA